MDGHYVHDDNVIMSIGESRLREMIRNFERCEVKKSIMDQVDEFLYDLEKPQESSLLEPTNIMPKGRPIGSTKYSTKRKPSHFEYTRANLEKYEKEKPKEW